jgi:hypothetical protein
MMKEDGRDLMVEFQELAPKRPPIKIQRWSVRRVLLTLGVTLAGLAALMLIVSNWAVFA